MFTRKFDSDDAISDNTCMGRCSRCGECCALFIPFTDRDVTRIKKYVKKHKIEPQNRDVAEGFKSQCCFYDFKNHLCTIYPVRPYVCSDFICNRKNWKSKRDEYESKATYNSTVKNKFIMATFDDMVYKNYYPILLHILSICKDANGNVDSKILIKYIKAVHREDLLDKFMAQDENGVEHKGTDLKGV